MTVELEEVREFLSAAAPFASLPRDTIADITKHMGMVYVRRGDTVIELGAENDNCYIIRSGAVDVLDSEGTLLDRRESGRSFGYSTLMGDGTSRYQMVAVEDSLLLTLPREAFVPVADQFEDFARFFSSQSKRMNAAADSLRSDTNNDILRTQLGSFMITTPATVPSGATIQEAAQMMQEKNVSSLLIVEDGELHGIVTDRDLRKKVVAVNLDVTLPVSDIMTSHPRTATSESQAFEAMIIMSELGIHHLPVVDDGKLTGIVSSPDIMRLLRNDPIYVTADLARKSDPAELREVFKSADDVAVRFIERGASPEEVSGLLTVAADSLARRLLTLGEEKFGPAPIPYSFVVVGSQGRRGMGLASDQDNCLVLSNDYDEAQHGNYFAELSEFVCRGLDEAGQILCPGDMMAMTPKWRMTQHQWIDTFREWITAPEPDNLLHAQTFFDFRCIYGDQELADEVHRAATEMAQPASRMHAHLATLAARREPPLGFFRGFVVERGGEYANTLDVKKGGTAAIVQMARLFALSSGVSAVGTRQRLTQSAGQGAVSVKGAQDLVDAFDFLNLIALHQQAEQVRRGEAPTYHIDPNALGKMDREHLRDAFQIIKSMQTALATKYPVRNI
ncbi:MAG: putative nucleotidyltransferase substrate binding domain-containing protein [Corynebacterium sp.]|uniref:putative nucleotidyltransferase substrate binding domain-containing protein n=1 Tax=Corynebacterium sp. TaxID=1720 RepID=UPI0026DD7251|nr:putative nucleotidyltransferase substrate binding domain-containing protein [Corynebacterium sp.]MDO5098283.1 putative nucleotidyltransferase substrate binding domain-containing protein [Corynebacterium sp.]